MTGGVQQLSLRHIFLVALAGVYSERSGIINLALEGIMIIGAFSGAGFVRTMQVNGWNEEQAQGPVSYTHLDVYKRQGICNGPVCGNQRQSQHL